MSYFEEAELSSNDLIVFDGVRGYEVLVKELSFKRVKLALDIGYRSKLGKLSDYKKTLFGKYNLVQLNQRVADLLLRKFNFSDYSELNDIFNCEFLVITQGKSGATYIVSGEKLEKKLEKVSLEVDPSGAGDAFYSVLIKNYINSEYVVTDSLVNKSFEEGSLLSGNVVKNIGALSHLLSFKMIHRIDKCNCGDGNEN